MSILMLKFDLAHFCPHQIQVFALKMIGFTFRRIFPSSDLPILDAFHLEPISHLPEILIVQ
jgi:hypothetical protein